ncbi:mono/diheme cytochrome c family protein [Bradyrhizobium sp. JR1.5]|uniref:c-type cytochrome n=1 Tax=unclassified Bradyrhizobium TaxID=2631580 RepID=UPI00339B9201
MIRFFTVLSVLCAAAMGATAETPIERGSYLVNAVMACDGCHTPRGPSGLNMERRFSGGSIVWDGPAYTVHGSNITPDRDTGIGAWSDADIKRLLTSSVRPNGVTVAPQMPYSFYRILTAGDLDAIVAYLKTIKPVNNEMPPPVYKAATYAVPLPGAETSIVEMVPQDPVKRGFYLATLPHCMECHSRKPDGTQDFKNWWGKGGHEMKGPFGSVIVANISSHKEKGVGAWTDAELKRALTEGISRDGRALKLPMARQRYFSKMTEQDLDFIVAWVRAIPPIEQFMITFELSNVADGSQAAFRHSGCLRPVEPWVPTSAAPVGRSATGQKETCSTSIRPA